MFLRAVLFVAFLIGANAVYITSPSDLPKITPNTTWEIYYLESPLFEEKLNYTLEHFYGFHSGIGFRNMNNPDEEHLFQYLADGPDYVFSAFYPEFEGPKKDQMVWKNGGFVDYQPELIKMYWTRQMFLGYLTSENLELFKRFALKYALEHNHYKFMEVISGIPIKKAEIYIKSQICHDFSFASMDYLSTFYVKGQWLTCAVRPLLTPRRDYIVYTTGSNVPTKVNMNDPLEYAKVLNFFKLVKLLIKQLQIVKTAQALEVIVEKLVKLAGGNVYVYVNEEDAYYQVKTINPYVTLSYDHSPTFKRCG
eukprot:TRINITY_DN774186_c0_g1_i1.p1 TRINITY_DN774186_c0_g1~~TRINITY_DN774186_c0_g1_i1.p1  ORF type:complete len:330 (+),score=31.50 TRINITY_DN774186_c0_g1_i1:67-990(+)